MMKRWKQCVSVVLCAVGGVWSLRADRLDQVIDRATSVAKSSAKQLEKLNRAVDRLKEAREEQKEAKKSESPLKMTRADRQVSIRSKAVNDILFDAKEDQEEYLASRGALEDARDCVPRQGDFAEKMRTMFDSLMDQLDDIVKKEDLEVGIKAADDQLQNKDELPKAGQAGSTKPKVVPVPAAKAAPAPAASGTSSATPPAGVQAAQQAAVTAAQQAGQNVSEAAASALQQVQPQ